MNYTITNPDQFRENIRGKLLSLLNGNDPVVIRMTDVTDKTAQNIEISIFNYAIKEAGSRKIVKKWDNSQFVQVYVDRLRSVYTNLKDPQFVHMIKSDELPAKHVGFMTHQEMKPEHWRLLIEQKIKRDQSRFTQNIEASTDMFTCKKCRSKRCTYYELQTRSADEPATIFITCLDCGKQFKN